MNSLICHSFQIAHNTRDTTFSEWCQFIYFMQLYFCTKLMIWDMVRPTIVLSILILTACQASLCYRNSTFNRYCLLQFGMKPYLLILMHSSRPILLVVSITPLQKLIFVQSIKYINILNFERGYLAFTTLESCGKAINAGIEWCHSSVAFGNQ